jgi:CBS domain-containing protein
MTQTIRELMTSDPVTLPTESTVLDAARRMKQDDIGDVIVLRDDQPCGVVTDRDLVVRAIADGRDPATTTLGEICSKDLVTLSPSDDVAEAVRIMRERAVRRIPIVEDGRAVGVISIGDLAIERDADSALADISAAPPNE